MEKKVVTFGEVMMRLTPPHHLRFNQTNTYQATFGGSEANVAVTLANFGIKSEFVTCLPKNRIGDTCIDDMRQYGVETKHILRGGERMGLYYMEDAASLRSTCVVYDRQGSSFGSLRKGMIDWEEIFKDATWFHWSGISAAITEQTAEMCREAINVASRMGLKISCDINYRKNLWQYGKDASEVLPELMEECDAMFGTDGEYMRVLGAELPPFEACDSNYQPDYKAYERVSKEVVKRFPRCKAVTMGLRNVINANHHTISGTLYTEGKLLTTRVYDIEPIVDCIGVGDAFVGGMIYGLFKSNELQYALDFGTATCALKNTIQGDYNQFPTEEIDSVAKGSTTGRIQR